MDKTTEALLDDALGDFAESKGGCARSTSRTSAPPSRLPPSHLPRHRGTIFAPPPVDPPSSLTSSPTPDPPIPRRSPDAPSSAPAKKKTGRRKNAPPPPPAGLGGLDLPARDPKPEKHPEGLGGLTLEPSKKGKKKKKPAAPAAEANPFANNPFFGGGVPGGFGGVPANDPFADLMGGGGMGGMGGFPPPPADPAAAAAQQKEMARQMKEFERQMTEMFKDIPPPDPKAQEEQSAKLRETIAALSGQNAQAAAEAVTNPDGSTKSLNPEEAAMKQMFEQMSGAHGGMQKMMDDMLQHLLSKDVLYEPMKEIAAKYPPWIKRNSRKIPDDELVRYEAQLVKVRAIIAAYEDDATTFADIVALLQEMQAFGMPPDEIMKEMANKNGMPLGANGLPNMFAGLGQQGAGQQGGGAGPKGMGGSGLGSPASGKGGGAGGPPPECAIM